MAEYFLTMGFTSPKFSTLWLERPFLTLGHGVARIPDRKLREDGPVSRALVTAQCRRHATKEVSQLGTLARGHVCLRLLSSRFGQNDTPPGGGSNLRESSDALCGAVT